MKPMLMIIVLWSYNISNFKIPSLVNFEKEPALLSTNFEKNENKYKIVFSEKKFEKFENLIQRYGFQFSTRNSESK